MKLHAILSTLLLVLLLSSGSIAQDLQLVQGNKLRTFKTGNLIRVDVPADEDATSETCPYKHFVGRLTSYKNDTLTLRVRHEGECIVYAGKKIGTQGKGYLDKNEEDWPVVEISGNNIISVTRQGSNKWQVVHVGDIVGNLLIIIGLIEMASSTLSENIEIEAGIATVGLGLIMVVVFGRKVYYIENSHNVGTKDKTWNIL